MKSLIATAALTFVFLSSGVVASIGHNHPAVRNVAVSNVTVIHKNQIWPDAAGCAGTRCADI